MSPVPAVVLTHGQRIIGASLLNPEIDAENHLLSGPCVLAEYRSRGLGTALLHHSLLLLKTHGLKRVHGVCKEMATTSKFVYPKFGSTVEEYDFEPARSPFALGGRRRRRRRRLAKLRPLFHDLQHRALAMPARRRRQQIAQRDDRLAMFADHFADVALPEDEAEGGLLRRLVLGEHHLLRKSINCRSTKSRNSCMAPRRKRTRRGRRAVSRGFTTKVAGGPSTGEKEAVHLFITGTDTHVGKTYVAARTRARRASGGHRRRRVETNLLRRPR